MTTWKAGDIISPEYYEKCVKLCKFRYKARYPQEYDKLIPPMAPIPPPCTVHISGCFGSRRKEGWYSMSQAHVNVFKCYDIPPYVEEKKSFLGFIKRIFKK